MTTQQQSPVDRHRHRHRRRAIGWWVGALLLAIDTAWMFQTFATGGTTGPTDVGTGVGSTLHGQQFTMGAQIVGGPLLLGQPRTLQVIIANPNHSPILVNAIDVSVNPPSAPGCPASWFQTGRYAATASPALVVAGGGTNDMGVAITLVNLPTVNQNACKSAQFSVSLTGSARQLP